MKTLKPKNPLRPAATAPLPLRISGKVPLRSYPKIPWNPKAERLISLWNLTGGSAAQQLIRPSNFRAIGVFFISISRLRYFKKFDANCLQTATAPQDRTVKRLQDPSLWIRRGHPPPHRRNGNTQHENNETPKSAPSNASTKFKFNLMSGLSQNYTETARQIRGQETDGMESLLPKVNHAQGHNKYIRQSDQRFARNASKQHRRIDRQTDWRRIIKMDPNLQSVLMYSINRYRYNRSLMNRHTDIYWYEIFLLPVQSLAFSIINFL